MQSNSATCLETMNTFFGLLVCSKLGGRHQRHREEYKWTCCLATEGEHIHKCYQTAQHGEG